MERRSLLTGAAALGLLSATGTSLAQTRAARVDEAKLPALMGGDFATATSQLALKKSRSAQVRNFARMEIEEQAATAMAFGSRPGAAGLSARHAALVETMQGLSGRAFDAAYIDGQITGHQELLRIHQRYARNGRDPMARGASMVGVPAIETHLALLKGIRQTLA
jgi:putative membrane protein